MARQDCGRGRRLAAVAVHLVLPAVGWVGAATLVRGTPAPWSTGAVVAAAVTALAVAWIGYPPAFAHRLEGLSGWSLVRAVMASGLVIALVVVAGRPLPGGRRAGVLWRWPEATNNVRPWVEPAALPWLGGGFEAAPAAADGGSV
jgi:hypothetical protein